MPTLQLLLRVWETLVNKNKQIYYSLFFNIDILFRKRTHNQKPTTKNRQPHNETIGSYA